MSGAGPNQPSDADAVLLAASAMGTRFELAIPRVSGLSDAHLRAVGEVALEEVVRWHGLLSRFEPSSLIALINREASFRPVRVPSDVLGLLESCEALRLQTGGAFNIAVGSLMDGQPGASELADPVIELDPAASTVRVTRAGVALDLGGIAKGWALDMAAEILREHRIGRALMHGGTSSVLGMGGEWGVKVTSGASGQGPARTVRLRDQVLSVSAPRGRMVGGQGHIVDPRTGLSAGTIDTASVIGGLGQAAMCEAWSTALVVLGSRPATCPIGLETWLHDAAGWRSE